MMVRRLAQPEELPLAEDVDNISVGLKKALTEAVESKEGRMCVRKLALTALITFNRERAEKSLNKLTKISFPVKFRSSLIQ